MLAAISRAESIAVDLFPVMLFFLLAHGGFLVTLPDLPQILRGWGPDASFVRWAVEVRNGPVDDGGGGGGEVRGLATAVS